MVFRFHRPGGGPKFNGEIFDYEYLRTLNEDPLIEDSLLDEPSWFAMDRNGWCYLPHNHDKRIQVFDSSGNYVRSIGRAGEGPGEFTYPKLQYLTGDTLSIFDPPQQRTTLYRTDGTLLGVMRTPSNVGYLDSMYGSSDGAIIGINSTGNIEGSSWQEGIELLIFSSSGDTLASRQSMLAETGYPIETNGPIRSGLAYDYAPDPSAAVDISGNRVLLNSGDEPLVQWYSMDGCLLEEVILGDRLEPLTRSMLRSEFTEWAKTSDRLPEDIAAARRSITDRPIRSHKAFSIRTIVDQGYIWLVKPQSALPRSVSRVCRIVSPEGEYIGDTTWPLKVHFNYANVMHGHFICMDNDDETGEQSAVVYRVHPKVEGLIYRGISR
ncbi:6-bladed beta-propeller [Gemmatimonadota bacterium]